MMQDTMPDRIWIAPTHRSNGVDDFYLLNPKYRGNRGTEYVRKDIAAEVLARLVEAAVAEYFLEPPMQTPDEWVGRRSAIRGMMVRLELYKQFTEALTAQETHQ